MFTCSTVFPGLVRMTFQKGLSAKDETAYLAALEKLSARTRPFVLMSVRDDISPTPPAARRGAALWFKRNRAHLESFCRGLVLVRTRLEYNKAFADAVSFPVLAFTDEKEALDVADELLTDRLLKSDQDSVR